MQVLTSSNWSTNTSHIHNFEFLSSQIENEEISEIIFKNIFNPIE
jgi:hypothetical protein